MLAPQANYERQQQRTHCCRQSDLKEQGKPVLPFPLFTVVPPEDYAGLKHPAVCLMPDGRVVDKRR